MDVEMDYWQERPKDLLIDERFQGMTPEEFMGYFWILQRGRTLTPPGVLPGNEALLQRWSRLKPAAWMRARDKILSFFLIDAAGNYHHPGTQKDYLSYSKLVFEKKLDGFRKVIARWKKEKVTTSATPPVFTDVYRPFGALRPVPGSGTDGQNTLFEQKIQVYSDVIPCYSTVGVIDRSTDRVDGYGADPPAPGAAVGPPMPPTPMLNGELKTALTAAKPQPPPSPPPRMTEAEFASKRAEAMARLQRESEREKPPPKNVNAEAMAV